MERNIEFDRTAGCDNSKNFSGETADPGFETVAKLVTSMGWSLNDIIENTQDNNEIEFNSIIAFFLSRY